MVCRTEKEHRDREVSRRVRSQLMGAIVHTLPMKMYNNNYYVHRRGRFLKLTHFLGLNDGVGDSMIVCFVCGGGGEEGGVKVASDPTGLNQGLSHGGSVVYG